MSINEALLKTISGKKIEGVHWDSGQRICLLLNDGSIIEIDSDCGIGLDLEYLDASEYANKDLYLSEHLSFGWISQKQYDQEVEERRKRKEMERKAKEMERKAKEEKNKLESFEERVNKAVRIYPSIGGEYSETIEEAEKRDKLAIDAFIALHNESPIHAKLDGEVCTLEELKDKLFEMKQEKVRERDEILRRVHHSLTQVRM